VTRSEKLTLAALAFLVVRGIAWDIVDIRDRAEDKADQARWKAHMDAVEGTA
jgi:hypothetical protein